MHHRSPVCLASLIAVTIIVAGFNVMAGHAAAPDPRRAPTVPVTPAATVTPCNGPTPTIIGFPTQLATIPVVPLNTETAQILQPTEPEKTATGKPVIAQTKTSENAGPITQITPTRRATPAIVVPQVPDAGLMERLSWLSPFQVLAVMVVLVVLVVGTIQTITGWIKNRPAQQKKTTVAASDLSTKTTPLPVKNQGDE